MAFTPKQSEVPARGTEEERKLFTKVIRHYDMSVADLDQRKTDWDTKDELFRSWIDENNWPYNSVVFDPRVFTFLFEKTARLFAKKPRGRMVPREGGDTLGARINNELLSFQWDENERVDGQPMLAKWAMMDQNARKYGASFALVKWRYERRVRGKGKEKKSKVMYDGPDFKPLVNRDVLLNPSYSTVKGWFAYREYVTLDELKSVNDASRTKPIYKNLDILQQSLSKEGEGGGDTRGNNWTSRNKSIKGITDTLGTDQYNKTIEVVTEYSEDKWVTYAPKHGVILRDIENPYDHGQIPVVMLRYYQVDDDIYGLSEIEPIERLQKAVNALVNQYLDAINMSLYTPLKIRANSVQMHTIEFGPGAKWIMNNPDDVVPHETSPSGVSEFASTYRFMISAMQEALGETSQGVSGIDPGGDKKTATEIKDSSLQRNARDNYNQIFLSEALKKQMMFWHTMNRQFLFDGQGKQKVIRIVGKDAIAYFQSRGLDNSIITDETLDAINAEGFSDDIQGEMQDLIASGQLNPQDFAQPQYPVNVDGEIMPKMTLEPGGQLAHVILEEDDLMGDYDYIPDVESMSNPDTTQIAATMKEMINTSLTPAYMQTLAQQGYQIKLKELSEDFYELMGKKDADKYFEKVSNEAIPGGQISPQAGLNGQGMAPTPGMGGGGQALPGVQSQPLVPTANPV